MNTKELSLNRSIIASVSMPLEMYVEAVQKAHDYNTSLSEFVRRALFHELEKTNTENENANSK